MKGIWSPAFMKNYNQTGAKLQNYMAILGRNTNKLYPLTLSDPVYGENFVWPGRGGGRGARGTYRPGLHKPL